MGEYIDERPLTGKTRSMATRRRKLVWALAGSLAVLAILAVVLAVFMTRRWAGFRKEVDAELAAIRDARQPVCVEDLSWFYPSPAPDQDMTKPILDALALLPKESEVQSRIEYMVGNWDELGPPDKWPARSKPADVERYLRENRHGIDCLEEAATKQGAARYPIELEADNSRRYLDRVLNLQTAARLLRLRANVSAEKGDAAQAGRAIRAIFGLARSLEREPKLLTFEVKHVIETIGCNAIAYCIPKIQLSTEDLADFDKALAHADEQTEIVAAFCGQRLPTIVLVQEDFRNQSAAGIVSRIGTQEIQHDFAQCLRYFGEVLACVKEPWPVASREAQEISDRWDKITARGSLPMTRMSQLGFLRLIEHSESAIARKNATRIIIAVERYRRDHHALPDRLDKLVPQYLADLPQDPFSEKPFPWSADDQGLAVYSVGPNGTDDHATGDDIVVRVKYTGEQMGGK
jgi:hypothetical protein